MEEILFKLGLSCKFFQIFYFCSQNFIFRLFFYFFKVGMMKMIIMQIHFLVLILMVTLIKIQKSCIALMDQVFVILSFSSLFLFQFQINNSAIPSNKSSINSKKFDISYYFMDNKYRIWSLL